MNAIICLHSKLSSDGVGEGFIDRQFGSMQLRIIIRSHIIEVNDEAIPSLINVCVPPLVALPMFTVFWQQKNLFSCSLPVPFP